MVWAFDQVYNIIISVTYYYYYIHLLHSHTYTYIMPQCRAWRILYSAYIINPRGVPTRI